MLPVYLFCLVLGGGFALLSAFGDVFESDAGDFDLDADADLDLDFDADVDGAEGAMASGHAAEFFSLRALVFSVFGFGATGSFMTWLGAGAGSLLTILFSVLAGLLVGGAVGSFLAYLKRSDTGARGSDRSYVGLPARVTLPIGAGSAGRIVVRRGDREHAIRALPYPGREERQPEAWEEVVVIEMRDGVAYVEPLSEEDRDLLP